MGLAGNLRYQLLNGMEFVMHHHLNDLGLVIFLSTALRCVYNICLILQHFILLLFHLILQFMSICNFGKNLEGVLPLLFDIEICSGCFSPHLD